MLIRRPILDRIRAGEVTLAFRRWRRPSVKSGGTLKTAVGVLAIRDVARVSERSINDRDARRAGYDDKKALLKELGSRDGELYRITLAYAGDDPRIALRKQSKLAGEELDTLRGRLARLDAAAASGPWTTKVLRAIAKHPMLPAIELAKKMGFEKAWLKINIRKLKNLGLTISHNPGYTLSPRGKAFLALL